MKHPPCQVCGCQNVNVLANAVAVAIGRYQERESRIESDLALDHIRGPFHDGSHPDCTICALANDVPSIEEQQAASLADAIAKAKARADG